MTPAEGGRDGAMAAMSALATACIARAAPVRLGVATSVEDVEAVYRLRHAVVVEQGWVPTQAFPDGLERDADDDAAVLIAGWHDDRVVATARLVRPAAGRPLPTEAAFDLTLAGRERLVDIGRVCVAAAYRDAGHRVFRGVLAQVWCEMLRHGYHEAVTVIGDDVMRLYERWGFGVTLLGPSRLYWGQRRSPARIIPAGPRAILGRWRRRSRAPAN